MQSVTVRRATLGDAHVLADLNRHVQDIHVEADPAEFHPTVLAEVEQFFTRMLTLSDHVIFIATIVEPVGYVWAHHLARPRNTFKNASNLFYVNHLAVAAGQRRAGVASALYTAVEDEAAKAGATEIALDHWTFNEDARRFFEDTGFSNFNVRMRKQVPLR